ncbi:MAG: ATP-binding protein [Methanomassiliicoccaceae archaeon]|nr:ATP-binding protein [Methanomassiliicoccaceae archaeon]
MFIGREQEIQALNEMYESSKLEVAVIYGRRRVGKTELINHFCRDKRTIFFTGVENSASYNLNAFTESVYKFRSESNKGITAKMVPRDFMQLLDMISETAQRERVVLVIDEYPYLAKAEKAFSSLLQKYIDADFKNTDMMMILCGSSMSFMERQVLSSKSPLYGRRTAQFKIEPFNYYDAIKFVPNYSKEDKLLTYGIFGGTPFYLAQIDDEKSLSDNVRNLFFKQNGLLFEEPSNLIKQELREPQIYNAIITAIANGSTKMSEIASKVNKPSNLCDIYIKKLISLSLVAKEKPLGEKTGTKSIYVLDDEMFKFWFRYVQDNLTLVAKGQGQRVIDNIWPAINNFMGRAFESVCTQYLWEHYDSLPISPKEIGRWWGSNPAEKQEEEIDILALDKNSAIFGECKFRNEKMGTESFTDLKRKSMLFPKQTTKYYYFFSKGGFTGEMQRLAKENDKIRLIGLTDLIPEEAC